MKFSLTSLSLWLCASSVAALNKAERLVKRVQNLPKAPVIERRHAGQSFQDSRLQKRASPYLNANTQSTTASTTYQISGWPQFRVCCERHWYSWCSLRHWRVVRGAAPYLICQQWNTRAFLLVRTPPVVYFRGANTDWPTTSGSFPHQTPLRQTKSRYGEYQMLSKYRNHAYPEFQVQRWSRL